MLKKTIQYELIRFVDRGSGTEMNGTPTLCKRHSVFVTTDRLLALQQNVTSVFVCLGNSVVFDLF